MSFAYQGFGFGEFFKAQQKLQDILEACFLGVFDAPSSFLSLARTLEYLADGIEHLFDENSNPNSAILRSDNKQNAQQMLRIASHGLMDCLKELETSLPIEDASRDKSELRGYNMVMALRLAGEEHVFTVLYEKFAFQAWKLELFFKVLRKSKIAQTLQVYDPVQKRLDSFLEELAGRKSTTSSGDTQDNSTELDSSGQNAGAVVIQRLQDACQFGSGAGTNFIWRLKPESTLLITLHWVFHLSQHNDPRTLPVEAYVNLMKCAWLLNVSSPAPGLDGFSDEMRTMIGLLGCETVYRLQEYFERDLEPPKLEDLNTRGDFRIFVEGVKKDMGAGLIRTAISSRMELPLKSPTFTFKSMSTTASSEPGSATLETAFDAVEDMYSYDRDGTLELTQTYSSRRGGSFSQPLRNSVPQSLTPSTRSIHSNTDTEHGYMSNSPTLVDAPLGSTPKDRRRRSTEPPPVVAPLSGPTKEGPTAKIFGSPTSNPTSPAYPYASRDLVPKEGPKKGKMAYSWNEMIDRANLGVRPGEAEILPKDFEAMHLEASYTGDAHGRWDDCRLRIFKYTADSTLRILTIMEGLDESIDQRIAYVKEAELVPDYGYHENHPVIYIRKTHRKNPFIPANQPKDPNTKRTMPPSSLFYRFRSAHDMFNFQLALLGESVETDFQVVRAVRYKKSMRDGEHNHYKARIQLWREQDADKGDVLASVPSIAPTVVGTARQTAKVKVHSTRLVMYWEDSVTTLFITDSVDVEMRAKKCAVRVRPSSHRAFNNPTTIKARAFGSREQPGGFRLDKKGLFPEDEESFSDYKWFEIEFNHPEEMQSFYAEFQRALNIRRKERWQNEELMRLAARGIMAGQPLPLR